MRWPRNFVVSNSTSTCARTLGKEAMQRAIDAFTAKIKSGTAALIYFNGFGIQAGRQTYLIPVGAQIWTEADVRRDGISIDAVLAELHRKGAQVKIVILDASRRNPFERRFRTSAAGLAATRRAGRHAGDVLGGAGSHRSTMAPATTACLSAN